MKKVLFQMRHGLGDAVQATIVVKHWRHYHPEDFIGVESWPGMEVVFRGVADAYHTLGSPADYRKDYDRQIVLKFRHSEAIYSKVPSSKPTQCLVYELNLDPIPELFRYEIHPSDEARSKAERYQLEELNGQPFGLLHYKGVSRAKDKNLTDYEAACLIDYIESQGLVAVVLDWNPNKTIDQMKGVARPSRLHPWLWGGKREGDALTIAALIERASLFYGIDSGPEHIAATTTTPTTIFWAGTSPVLCFDPAPNVLHLIPRDIEKDNDFFRRNYRWEEYGAEPNDLFDYIEFLAGAA